MSVLDCFKNTKFNEGFLLCQAALKLGYKVEIVDKRAQFWKIKGEDTELLFKLFGNPFTPIIFFSTRKATTNKRVAKILMLKNGIPTPRFTTCTNRNELPKLLKKYSYPVVIKSIYGSFGKYVYMAKDIDEAQKWFSVAQKRHPVVIIEEYVEGNDYRILVLFNRVIAVVQRIPPYVVGDGKKTLQKLIEIENKRRVNMNKRERMVVYHPIKINEKLLSYLAFTKKDLGYVPKKDEKVRLSWTANWSGGGYLRDLTDKIDKSFKKIAIDACKACNVLYGGVDIISPDITKPYKEVGGWVLEVNSKAEFSLHHVTHEGKRRDIASIIIKSLIKYRKMLDKIKPVY